MFNSKRKKLMEDYKKCLQLMQTEKYNTIDGVINFHQEYLNDIKANPVDYWQSLMTYYEALVKEKKYPQEDLDTFAMLLEELKSCQDDYFSYYMTVEKLKKLESKLNATDKQACQEEIKGKGL